MTAVGGPGEELLLAFRPYLPLFHGGRHRVPADVYALGVEDFAHTRTAVHLAILFMHELDLLG